MIGEVIESKRWIHKSGATASIYGAAPWTDESDRCNWEVEKVGYTIQWEDGTVGMGRKPFESKEEAEAFLKGKL